LLADVTWSQAAMELSRRNFSQAAMLAKKAFDLAGPEYKAIAVRAGATLCVAQSRSNQIAAARKRCQEAVNLARTIRDPRSLTDALIASAEAAIAAGDAESGLQQAAEAADRCAAARQLESEWWSRAAQARASEMAGDKVKARQFASRALELLSSLEAKWGSNYFKSFLARGDVDELNRQILLLSNP